MLSNILGDNCHGAGFVVDLPNECIQLPLRLAHLPPQVLQLWQVGAFIAI